MKQYHTSLSAVMLLLMREGEEKEILLQQRSNTGYMDGRWDCAASGHVDAGESMKQAMVREAKEELNVDIAIADLEFVGIMHKQSRNDVCYFNGYFLATKFRGIPIINEPKKCSELQWFPLTQLPLDIIEDRKTMIENFQHGVVYDEFGWEELA